MNTREKWAELQEDKNYNPYKGISKEQDYNLLLIRVVSVLGYSPRANGRLERG